MDNLRPSEYLLPLCHQGAKRRVLRAVGSDLGVALWVGVVTAILAHFWMHLLNSTSITSLNLVASGIVGICGLLGLGVGIFRHHKIDHKNIILAANELDRAWDLDVVLTTGIEVYLGKLTGSMAELAKQDAELQARDIAGRQTLGIPLVVPHLRMLVLPLMLLIGLMALQVNHPSSPLMRFTQNVNPQAVAALEAIDKNLMHPNAQDAGSASRTMTAREIRKITKQQNIERTKFLPADTNRRSLAQAQHSVLTKNLNAKRDTNNRADTDAMNQNQAGTSTGAGQNNKSLQENLMTDTASAASKSFKRHFRKYSRVVNAYFLSWAEESRL